MRFDKSKFIYDNGWLFYGAVERKFVARFKYRGPVTAAKLKAVLVKYYTTDEYFSRMATHTETPLGILMKDGWLKHENGKVILDGKVLN
jgi:hypothetical protein